MFKKYHQIYHQFSNEYSLCWIIVEYSKEYLFRIWISFLIFILCQHILIPPYTFINIMNIYKNIHMNYQGSAPGMDKEVWRKSEWRLESWGWGLKVWQPLHVLRRDSEHVGWAWLVGSARATTAAALHFRGRCRGGAPQATRAAHLVNTFLFCLT